MVEMAFIMKWINNHRKLSINKKQGVLYKCDVPHKYAFISFCYETDVKKKRKSVHIMKKIIFFFIFAFDTLRISRQTYVLIFPKGKSEQEATKKF